MATRLDLQSKLEEILGSRNVYYQPPESIKMEYPAIVYVKSNIQHTFADNNSYLNVKRYDITVIDKMPDNPVIMELLKLPYCSFNRHFKSENLNHDVLTLFF